MPLFRSAGDRIKIASIVGARRNFIKCAPVSRELRNEFDEVLIHSGQHYDYGMNKVFFDEPKKIPELESYHLGVGSGNHGEQTGEILKRTEEVLLKEAPDLVFCPTETAVKILGTEGIENGVHLTDDVMVDALQGKRIKSDRDEITERIKRRRSDQ